MVHVSWGARCESPQPFHTHTISLTSTITHRRSLVPLRPLPLNQPSYWSLPLFSFFLSLIPYLLVIDILTGVLLFPLSFFLPSVFSFFMRSLFHSLCVFQWSRGFAYTLGGGVGGDERFLYKTQRKQGKKHLYPSRRRRWEANEGGLGMSE